jgi:hypothetical protein
LGAIDVRNPGERRLNHSVLRRWYCQRADGVPVSAAMALPRKTNVAELNPTNHVDPQLDQAREGPFTYLR